MSKDRCVCGHPYLDHPDGDPSPPRYRLARQAFKHAVAQVIYWPGISDSHRRAIMRARLERRGTAA